MVSSFLETTKRRVIHGVSAGDSDRRNGGRLFRKDNVIVEGDFLEGLGRLTKLKRESKTKTRRDEEREREREREERDKRGEAFTSAEL